MSEEAIMADREGNIEEESSNLLGKMNEVLIDKKETEVAKKVETIEGTNIEHKENDKTTIKEMAERDQ